MIVRRLPLRQGRRTTLTRLAPPCSRTPITTTATATATRGDEYAARRGGSYAPEASRALAKKPMRSSRSEGKGHRGLKEGYKMGAAPREGHYDPADVLLNPPKPEHVSLEMLMAAQTHMGHHRSLWNPHNTRYIYGIRQGIHIISLEQTAAHLRRAARVVEEVAYNGGLILFVGSRKGQMPIVAKAAEMAGACHLFTKWTPGTITNRDLILGKQALKAVDEHDKTLSGFDLHLLDQRPLVPDLVVCLNPLDNFVMLYECGLKSIPTIGVIDTNANPSWVTYVIPANDDSLRSIAVIAGVLGRAGGMGVRRRLQLAREHGEATWQMRPETLRYLKRVAADRQRARERGEDGSRDIYADIKREERDEEASLLGLEDEPLQFSQKDVLDVIAQGQKEYLEKLDNELGDTIAGARPAPKTPRPGPLTRSVLNATTRGAEAQPVTEAESPRAEAGSGDAVGLMVEEEETVVEVRRVQARIRRETQPGLQGQDGTAQPDNTQSTPVAEAAAVKPAPAMEPAPSKRYLDEWADVFTDNDSMEEEIEPPTPHEAKEAKGESEAPPSSETTMRPGGSDGSSSS